MRRVAHVSVLAGVIALFAGMIAVGSDADARRRVGGGHIGKVHIKPGKVVHVRPGRVVRRNVRRAGRWVNGVWIVNGVAASVAIGTASNCGYYYRKWRETGSAYWRDRYYEHCR